MITNTFTTTGDVVGPAAPGEDASFAATNSYSNYLETVASDWTNNDAMCEIGAFPTTVGAKFTMEARGNHGRLEALIDTNGAQRINYYIGTTLHAASGPQTFAKFYKMGYDTDEMIFWTSSDGRTWTEVARGLYTPPTAAACRFYGYNATATTDRIIARWLNTVPPANTAPTANAGADQTAVVGTVVTVTGSGTDPEGGALTYDWAFVTVPTGSTSTLSGTGASRTFTPNKPGAYTLRLTVTDPGGLTATDDVIVNTNYSDHTVGWTAATAGEAALSKYEIEGLLIDQSVFFTSVPVGTHTVTNVDAQPGTIYRVRAVDVNGVAGEWSDTKGLVGTDVLVDDGIIVTTAGQELTWTQSTGWQKSAAGEHYSDITGSSRTVHFRGTRAVLYGAKDKHHGEFSMDVDGGVATTHDTYSGTRQDEAVLADTGQLADGLHAVRMTVNGTKNASSTGFVVASDYAIVTSTGLITPPSTTAPKTETVWIDQDFSLTPDTENYINNENRNSGTWPWVAPDFPWYKEHTGLTNLHIRNGRLVKAVKTEDYHRLYFKHFFEFPLGKIITVEMFQASADVDAGSTGSHPGLKVSPSYPDPNNPNKYSPLSVHDTTDAYKSASLQSFTGLTKDGRLEISNQVWGTGYRYSPNNYNNGYVNNTVVDLKTTFEFFSNSHVRTRQYIDGVLKKEWDDPAYPIGGALGFYIRWRGDDTAWSCRRIRIAEAPL